MMQVLSSRSVIVVVKYACETTVICEVLNDKIGRVTCLLPDFISD